jgi:hypothetical protein
MSPISLTLFDAAPVPSIPILLMILLPIVALICVLIAVAIIHHRKKP